MKKKEITTKLTEKKSIISRSCCLLYLHLISFSFSFFSLCCGNDPEFLIQSNGNTVAELNDLDFGDDVSYSFGNCDNGGGGGGATGPACVPVTMELMTDDYGEEIEIILFNDLDQELIWYQWGFDDNEMYTFSACIDPSGCSTFEVFDSYGDGLTYSDPYGYVKLTYDGTVIFNTGDYDYGEVFRLGDACSD